MAKVAKVSIVAKLAKLAKLAVLRWSVFSPELLTLRSGSDMHRLLR